MYGFETSDDYRPVGWIGRYPIHAATLLVLIQVGAMIATAIASSMGYGHWMVHTLAFSSEAVLDRFAFWQFATYPLVQEPSISFAIEMYLLFAFGREVERFIGRHAFLSLYALLILMPPCLLTPLGVFGNLVGEARGPINYVLVGSGTANFCIFIAFATIYPNVRLMFGLIVKWVAAVLFAIYTLQRMMGSDWSGMLVLWASAALAFGGIRRLRRQPILEGFSLPAAFGGGEKEPLQKRYGAKGERAKAKSRRLREEGSGEEVDAILDKISLHGLSSLSSREREKLEHASRNLSAKERGH